MDDPEVAAAIAAGELDGLAAVLDKYAASLYEYCYSMAPEVAADAVQDTFIIAWSKLGGLRDPGQLHSWLQAVAGNECFRRTLAGSVTDAHADVAPAATPPPETTLPPGLPGHILSACADNTPAGRANRTSVTHRAGPFGYDGFPKANALRGTWQRRFQRHRQAGAAVAAAAVLAAAVIMIVAIAPASSSHHHLASAASPGSRPADGSTVSGT
ncbi:MAG TPA: sigma factor, partial [Streptosporangiaceae bacterium]|nr:sigma factor [Streptosporangiaceae bacterium]